MQRVISKSASLLHSWLAVRTVCWNSTSPFKIKLA